MKFAYADPPYLGQAAKIYGDPMYDDPDAHRELVEELQHFDAWALSLSSPSLHLILPMCPGECRIGSWVKPFASYKPGVDPAYTWEPLIFKTSRTWDRKIPTVRDHLSSSILMGAGLKGAKPPSFSYWLFDLLGAGADDDFTDMFPGSGMVSYAWNSWREQTRMALEVAGNEQSPRKGETSPYPLELQIGRADPGT